MDEHMPTLSKSPAVDLVFAAAFKRKVRRWDKSARVILFGSRAQNRHRFDSDYDLLILSNKFNRLTPERRWLVVQTQLKPSGFDGVIEPHCYTLSEWNDLNKTLLHREITRHGVNFLE